MLDFINNIADTVNAAADAINAATDTAVEATTTAIKAEKARHAYKLRAAKASRPFNLVMEAGLAPGYYAVDAVFEMALSEETAFRVAHTQKLYVNGLPAKCLGVSRRTDDKVVVVLTIPC